MHSMNHEAMVDHVMKKAATSVEPPLFNFSTDFLIDYRKRVFNLKNNPIIVTTSDVSIPKFLKIPIRFLKKHNFDSDVILNSFESYYFFTLQIEQDCFNEQNCTTAKTYRIKHLSLSHVLSTGLTIITTILSYVVMLLFMTFNIWICLCIVIGHVFGFFLFNTLKPNAECAEEHCT
ncbi:hypothetical protein A3Q56_03623 [Intoshia linei]|uniref:Copper transport protein n=1 Tax=Intoshia linei TaxID=1819745 RepID=A0A177B2J3_9BILA|nr:hypothetical protein A3Q56_03623 [Intoshia linei]